jgi:hypothetical protein
MLTGRRHALNVFPTLVIGIVVLKKSDRRFAGTDRTYFSISML